MRVAQSEHAFSFEPQFLAANGYVVLQVNYRGSGGRGSKYQKAIFADWGHLEVVDLLLPVRPPEHVAPQLDEERYVADRRLTHRHRLPAHRDP